MNSLAISSKRVRDLKGNEVFAKKTIERARTCRGYVIRKEQTPKLKIAGANISLGLCDSRNCFACLTHSANRLTLTMTFELESY